MVGAFSAQLTYHRYFWVSEINRCSLILHFVWRERVLGRSLACSRRLGTFFQQKRSR